MKSAPVQEQFSRLSPVPLAQEQTVVGCLSYPGIRRLAPRPSRPLLRIVDLPLVATQPVLARECLVALVAHSTLRRVPARLGPRLVIAPNMSVLFILVLCFGPTTVFFGALAMDAGVISERC